MMLLFATIFISYITSVCLVKIAPSKPVPHAAVLDDILRRNLGSVFTQNSDLDYILGAPKEANDTQIYTNTHDNLDVKILDIDNIRKIINFASEKYEQQTKNTRRNMAFWINNKYIVGRATEQTKQALYFTQERINATLPYRQKYKDHPSYTIGVLYGAAQALITKMENLEGDMNSFYWRTHFLWFLIMYERILAANIDIGHVIEKIFTVHEEYVILRGPKEYLPSSDLTQYKQRTLPPHVLQQQKVAQAYHSK